LAPGMAPTACSKRSIYPSYLVGRTGFEPVTSSVSGKRSPAELTARVPRRDATRARTPPRAANGRATPRAQPRYPKPMTPPRKMSARRRSPPHGRCLTRPVILSGGPAVGNCSAGPAAGCWSMSPRTSMSRHDAPSTRNQDTLPGPRRATGRYRTTAPARTSARRTSARRTSARRARRA
jgi:hypothetical protein